MGRSKFPGKPSKHVNRKRVNVLPPNGEGTSFDDDSVTVTEDKQVSNSNIPSTPSNDANVQNISLKRRLTRNLQNSNLRNKTVKRNLISRMCSKNVIKGNISNKRNRTKNGRALARKCYSTLKSVSRGNQREAGTLGKFILPSRSVHSSRVIKPNKRFLDLNESLTRKQKIHKRQCSDKEQEDSEAGTSNGSQSNGKEASASNTCSNRRIILRQARLQFQSHSYPSNSQGPFSSTSNNGSGPGTVTCGVCGAVRFYRFIKQARKFNIYSCESCRKFISKMIKRQSYNKGNALVCHKGQGTCHVPPIVRSQQWKLIKCAYRARCPACWLKMCLRSFQMPVNLRNNLSQLLPAFMQTPDSMFGNNSLFWSTSIRSVDVNINKSTPTASPVLEEKSSTSRPLRSNNSITATTNNPPTSTEIKRQKVDLKGPRVKHVCRSASIVLGQPVATFSEVDKIRPDKNEVKENVSSEVKSCVVSNTGITEKSVTWKEKSDTISSESESIDSDKLKYSSVSDVSISTSKKDRSHRITSQFLAENKSNEKNRTTSQLQHSISIDFWENYDPEDVSQNGFSLISCEKFPMPSICFLCGSAGLEALLHCSACCEPYHPFCLEQAPQLDSYNIKQSMWLCPRCTVCSSCNQSDRTKVNCQKCYKAYHIECLNYGFNTKWSSEERPTVCSKCLRCKSCGTENITKFVGNLPLCLTCLKLRKKGNFCPLCQKCYYENDFCSKMMECANCNKWVHSKCEGLLEEQYQILSLLPESIEYICKLCSKNTTPLWRKAVDSELKASFNNVLRLLSKNKVARDLLKWSPLNNTTSTHKTITTVRKIQFGDNDTSSGIDQQNNNNIENVFPNKQAASKYSNIRTMLDIKNKLNSNEYHSVREYNMEMEEALNHTRSEQIVNIYRSILHNVFPWYENSEKEETEHISICKVEEKVDEITSDNIEINYVPQIESSCNDTRVCGFCKGVGDGLGEQESRLLYCGQNEWVHANCALWSAEVYEEIDGSLQNVHGALSRGRSIKCAHCKQKGASVGCCFKGCYETFHFTCARKVNCIFLHDKTVYCGIHQLPKNSNIITSSHDFDIRRSVYVELDKKKGKFCEIDKVNFMVGSLSVTNLGKIIPTLSDSYDALIPIGFVCSRLFWSTVEPWKLVCYNITTSPNNNNPNTFFADRNFTIDHTLPKTAIDKKFRELNIWQKDLEKRKSELMDMDEDEEPQNTADILSPELTDAILKELPHDLLDGISVQDIIPKLMPFEDLQNIDTSNSESSNAEESDPRYGRELKRSKSDLFLQMNESFEKVKEKNSRSCSVTLSCKLDRSLSPVLKKRKVVPSHENNLYFKLLQVDGNFDDSASECGSPTRISSGSWQIVSSEEPVTCEKCQCTYRTQASYKRHLDNCELLCTSESDSELVHEHESNSFQETRLTATCINAQLDSSIVMDNSQPMMINSFESYQNQLHTSVLNTFVKSKSSQVFSTPQNASEMMIQNSQLIPTQCNIQHLNSVTTPITINQQSLNDNHNDQTFTITQQNIPINESISVSSNQSLTIPNNFCVNQAVPLCVNQPVHLQPNTLTVNQTPSLIGTSNGMLNPITLNQIAQPNIQSSVEFQQPVTLQSVPFAGNVNQPIINIGTQNQINLNGKILTNNNLLNTVVNMPTNQWVKPIGKPIMQEKMMKARPRTKTIISKKGFGDNEAIVINTQNSTPTPVILQHLPSTNFVPTFVDTFQQQAGQNVQYIATIAPQINQTSQPFVQIQPENNLISLVPGMQPVIIQQPRVLENQLVMDSNGTISWAQAPQTVQPVYYGFETIVQNTVMQSQQFLPTTVPGVLAANSSYSTTTQVFQTSKLEPVLDVASNSFVLVNPGQLISSQASMEIPRYSQPIKTIPPTTTVEDMARAQPMKFSIVSTGPTHKPTPQLIQQQPNSINLPTAPFVQEQGIPTNIVTPTPKPVQVQNRPMNRVLPMQTTQIKQVIKAPEIQKLQEIRKPKLDLHTLLENQKIMESKKLICENRKPSVDIHEAFIDVQKPFTNMQKSFPEVHKSFSEIQRPYTDIQKSVPEVHKPYEDIQKKFSEVQKPLSDIQESFSVIQKAYPDIEKSFVDVRKPLLSNHNTQAIQKAMVVESPLLEIQKSVDSLQTCLSSEKPNLNKEVPPASTVDINMPSLNIQDFQCELNKSPIFENLAMQVDNITSGQENMQNCSTIENLKELTSPISMETDDVTPILECKIGYKKVRLSEADELFNSLIEDQKLQIPIEKPIVKPIQKENIDTKNESLRIVFQKQSRDGTYKISNNFSSKTSNVQVAPLKPIKSNNLTTPLSQINNRINNSSLPKHVKKEKKNLATNDIKPVIQDKKINDSQSILYTIETQDGFRYTSTSVADLWSKVFETVQNARAAHNMPPLPEQSQNVMNDLHVLGSKHNGLKYLLEQLPAVSKCTKYKPSYHFSSVNIDLEDEFAVGHSFGSVRCAPHTKRYNQYDMFGWLSSKHRRPENAVIYDMELPRRGSINNLPMAMRFRQLKLTSRYSVGVYRSNIHGRGLFCLRDIEAGEMVIEYAGEVIRSILCDKREKEYNQKGIGCYMFRIDDNLVVDATMKGNAARFINHSCDPNCYSKVVEILGHKHIIIFALRRILYSEELTYDYKFPFEEDKIPCTCGTRRCRKFLN